MIDQDFSNDELFITLIVKMLKDMYACNISELSSEGRKEDLRKMHIEIEDMISLWFNDKFSDVKKMSGNLKVNIRCKLKQHYRYFAYKNDSHFVWKSKWTYNYIFLI